MEPGHLIGPGPQQAAYVTDQKQQFPIFAAMRHVKKSDV
jgi:hypothetical protein